MEDFKKIIIEADLHMSRLASVFIKIVDFDILPRVMWDYRGRFVRVNKRFAEALGYTPHDFLLKDFKDFIHPPDHNISIREYLEATKAETDPQEFKAFSNRYVCKDGSLVMVEWISGFNDRTAKIGTGQAKITKIENTELWN